MGVFNFNIDIVPIKDNEVKLEKKEKAPKTTSQIYKDCQYVDMGLPSKTLWAKYNLGVDILNLDRAEDWYGEYFAWGEIKPKESYTWSTYKLAAGKNRLIRYCERSYYGVNDGLSVLKPSDDAATRILGDNWSIPTRGQLNELIRNTNFTYTNKYNGIKGLTGVVFGSKINDEELFIPTVGFKGNNVNEKDVTFYLWANSIYVTQPTMAYAMIYNKEEDNFKTLCFSRYNGCTIRPVYYYN